MIRLERAYDQPSKQNGLRILVERLWPRDVSREKAAMNLELKDLAPSMELRKWFGHAPEKWDEFRKRYWSELREKGDLLTLLKHRTTEGNVTFAYAASDEEQSRAAALKEYLDRKV